MPADNARLDALTYADDDPAIPELQRVYEETLSDLSYYFAQSRASFDTRRNIWPGKSPDNRKKGADAFPWAEASDLDAPVAQERIHKLVGHCTRALARSHIKAYPIGVEDAARSKVVSTFLKWLQQNGIRNFSREVGRGANYWFEKFIMITHVGYESGKISANKKVLLRDIEEDRPEIAMMIEDPDAESGLADELANELGIGKRRARRAIRELRNKGETTIPFSEEGMPRPTVRSCSPDYDVIFPSWCIDPQEAPFAIYRELMTPQDILSRVASEGWDEEWAEYVVEHHRGKATELYNFNRNALTRATQVERPHRVADDLIEVLWFYQRLIDRDDNSTGIYCTIFSPRPSEDSRHPQGVYEGYAKRELLSCTRYPLVTTKLWDDEQRLYEGQSVCDMVRSGQKAVKNERDSRIDSNSLRTVPPMLHPVGAPPLGTWGPKQNIGYMSRPDEFRFADVPGPNPMSVGDEQILLTQVDRLLGLDPEDPDGVAIKDYFIGRFLEHWRDVLDMAYEMEQKYGPEERFFRVTGQPDLERMTRKEGERLDISVTFDTLMNDPETARATLETFATLFQFDDGGKLGRAEFLEIAAMSISPTIAAHVIKPAEQGAREFARKVAEDLTFIRGGGIEVNAQPNGAPMAMQLIQQWAAQPDVAAELQQNPLFVERLQKYVMQYVFQIQQQQNAVTGRLGTPPANFDVTQQDMGTTPRAYSNGQ